MGQTRAEETMNNATGAEARRRAVATFAGGCFWCMEPPFEKLEGVLSVTAGYAGGTEPHPTYEAVSSGKTGYAESVEIVYDPAQISYEQLVEVFWMNIDPTTPNQQFADKGRQYRTAIFYHTEEQQRLAEASKAKLGRSGKFQAPIVTDIVPATPFYPAEEYHQDYSKKHPLQYKLYRIGSGREGYLQRLWGGRPR
ncbi:MAG: peptide-methionine (S)-S-oxide reductase MsrA [Candidatus Omnitrophica bacterium]|nr:peptide-methionine (S)-S-oxide reductase MsrA [Candidatus Omnitrophota bacterium]